MTLSYKIALQIQTNLYAEMREASKRLHAFPRLANGMHADSVKQSPEYKSAKREYETAFRVLQSYNKKFRRNT